MKTALITGINGQDGSYLSELLLDRGYRVIGLARSPVGSNEESSSATTGGAEIICGDLRDEQQLRVILERYAPKEIYNLAARASSSQLIDQPLLTGDVNGLAVVRLLEVIRTTDPAIRFCQARAVRCSAMPPNRHRVKLPRFVREIPMEWQSSRAWHGRHVSCPLRAICVLGDFVQSRERAPWHRIRDPSDYERRCANSRGTRADPSIG